MVWMLCGELRLDFTAHHLTFDISGQAAVHLGMTAFSAWKLEKMGDRQHFLVKG